MVTANVPDYQSLLAMMEAAQMGWWTADLAVGELYFSDLLMRQTGLKYSRITFGRAALLARPDYRPRLHARLMAVVTDGHFDETFPVRLPDGEAWIHARLVSKQSDAKKGMRLFGYAQRVPIRDASEAELLTLESNYRASLRLNEHMDELLDHLPIGYFRVRLLYNEQGRAVDYLVLTLNLTAQEILGVDPAEYIDRTAREIGIDVGPHIDTLAAIQPGDYKVDEWRAPRTGRYCRSFLYNTPNDPTELVFLILDVSDSVTTHQALDEQEKLLRNIVQTAPVGVELFDREGRLIMVNIRNLEVFGVENEESLLGLNIFDDPNFTDRIKDRIRMGEEIDFTAIYDFSKVGSYYRTSRCGVFDWTARIRCLYDARGELSHYLVINIDNTELRQTQNRLTQFEALFRMVSEYANVGYANYNLCTLEGHSQGTWLRNYGESEKASVTEVVGGYTHVFPEERAQMKEALRLFYLGRLRSKTLACRIRHDDGQVRWINSHFICRDYRPDEGVIDMLSINYDITALKETEQALLAAKERAEESNKLKSAFLANMSHEIRTPLNAIVGFSELLVEEEDAAARREYVDIISLNNDLLLQIISDVLDLARIESGRIEIVRTDFEARDLCREVVDTFRLQAHADVELRMAGGLPQVMLCEYKQGLFQILGNFVRNAVKFTSRGSIVVGFEAFADRIRFYVRDTGIGIAPEQLSHIFERFYKADTFTQGTGLGLSICKSVAEQMGGRIVVESCLGEGSCFAVEIPRSE